MVKKIVFVCLGNICRSPAAEGVFKKKIRERDLENFFLVDSAGTGGWHVGNLADPRMRETALSRGIELTSRSRKIEESDLYEFDHILVMDNDNLDAVKSLIKLSPSSPSGILDQRKSEEKYCLASTGISPP